MHNPGFQLILPPQRMHYSGTPLPEQGDAVHHASFLLRCTFPPIQWPTKISRDHATWDPRAARILPWWRRLGNSTLCREKEWVNLLPDSSSRGRCALREAPPQHHSQLHGHFKAGVTSRGSISTPPSHSSLPFVLVQVLQPHRKVDRGTERH